MKIIIGIVAIIIIVFGIIEVSNLLTPIASQQSKTTSNTSANVAKLQIEDIKIGTGAAVKSGDTVVMNYKGTLQNGKQFDSSYDRGTPFETKIGVGQVIPGWDQGIPGMKVGGIRKLIIPPNLGYGSQSIGTIPPNSTLIFQVELLQIK